MSQPNPTRRHVLAGAAGLTAAALLAACGSDEPPAPPAAGPPAPAAEPPAPVAAPTRLLAKTSDIPVNGGRIFPADDVIVTQPVAGEFKGFSAKCTHKGCTLASVENGVINCGCHHAMFAATDGTVLGGPALTPLPARGIRVDGDNIELA